MLDRCAHLKAVAAVRVSDLCQAVTVAQHEPPLHQQQELQAHPLEPNIHAQSAA